ncbi:MAG: AMIN domain-containing protein [Candidatus Aminicenantes bacterium]|nr:AMIN domain-containing protein [Candidatus Aminicenantes bacterium]
MKLLKHRMGRPIFLLFLMILAAAPSLRSQTSADLKEISLQKDGDRLNVSLKIEGAYTVEASFLPSPPRLVIDLAPITRIQVLPYTQIDDIGVLDIRTGQFKPDTARVVFDLSRNVPAYSVTQTADGLKITFWFEGEVQPIEVPVKDDMIPDPRRTTPAVTAPAAASQIPADGERANYFLAVRAGAGLFLGADLLFEKTFDMYGETATLEEAYGSGLSPAFEIQIGKYSGRTKFGFGATLWFHNQKPLITADLPHPFLMNANRSVELEPLDVRNPMWNFSLFALFTLSETDKMTLMAGPMLGLTKGKFQTVDDFTLEEKSPFSAADVSVSEYVFYEDLYSELLFGGIFQLEYRLSDKLALLGDVRVIYVNPILASVNLRANLLHVQPVIGLQFNF